MKKAASLSASSPHGHPTVHLRYWEKYLVMWDALLDCDHVTIGACIPFCLQTVALTSCNYKCLGTAVQNKGLCCMKKYWKTFQGVSIFRNKTKKHILLIKTLTKSSTHPGVKTQKTQAIRKFWLFSAGAPGFNLIRIEEQIIFNYI